MTVKMQKFTKENRAIIKNDKGFFTLSDRFQIEDVVFHGRLYAALGAGHAVTGELYSDVNYDNKIIAELASLVTHSSEFMIVVYRSCADRYQAVLHMRLADGRLHEIAKTLAAGPMDAIAWLGAIMKHADYLEAIVKPAVMMVESPPVPKPKPMSAPMWFSITLIGGASLAGLIVFGNLIINKLF